MTAKVMIERRGGFAGLVASGERELSALTADERAALDRLLGAGPLPRRSPGADRFRYRVRITGDDGEKEIEVSEDAMPDQLAKLAKFKL